MMSITPSSIATGSIPFSLYSRDTENRMVLFCRAGMQITPTHQQILGRTSRVFFITGEDMDQYLDYTFTRLERTIRSRDVRARDKAQLLRDVGTKVINSLLEQPRSAKAIRQSELYVRNTIDFLLLTPEASVLLTSTIATDASLMAHAIGTSIFCILLGKQLRESDRELLYILGMGGLLMDIGMSQLETADHLRPGLLPQPAREKMQRHPEFGAEIATEHHLSPEIVSIIRNHHERLDGSGYPRGIAEDTLELTERIAAIADVYDALTSPRNHRAAYSHLRALRIMADDRGKYDPAVFDALLRIVLKNDMLVETFQKQTHNASMNELSSGEA